MQQLSLFQRDLYYSQTDVIRKYKISVKKYKELIKEKGFNIHSVHIDYITYSMDTIYILKSDIDSLGLELRIKKGSV